MPVIDDIVPKLVESGFVAELAAPLLAAIEAEGLDLDDGGGASPPLATAGYEARPIEGRSPWLAHSVAIGSIGSYQWIELAGEIFGEAMVAAGGGGSSGSPAFAIVDLLGGDIGDGDVNNWTGAAGQTCVLVHSSYGYVTLRGIDSTGVADGTELVLLVYPNADAFALSFEDAASTDVNRLYADPDSLAAKVGILELDGNGVRVFRFIYGPTMPDGTKKRWMLASGPGTESQYPGTSSAKPANVTGAISGHTYTSSGMDVFGAGNHGAGAVACAVDKVGGSGWSAVGYSLDGGTTWTTFTDKARFVAVSGDSLKVRGTSGGTSVQFYINIGNVFYIWQVS
jgi:hypothetical protein